MWRTGPNRSDRASAIARAVPGWKRWLKPTLTRRRAASAARTIRPTSSTPMPAGFSTRTCADASRARQACSASWSCGTATITTSSSCASSSSSDRHANPPNRSAKRLEPRAASRSKQATSLSRPSAAARLLPDEPTADDADAKRGPLRCRHGHVYSTPTQPWNSKSNRSSGASAAAMASRVSSGRRA